MKPSYFRIIFQINCQGAMWSHQQVEWVYIDKNLVKKYVIALYCMYKFSLELCSMHMCQNHISCHSVHKALKDSGPREAVSLFCLCLCTWDMYWVYFFLSKLSSKFPPTMQLCFSKYLALSEWRWWRYFGKHYLVNWRWRGSVLSMWSPLWM